MGDYLLPTLVSWKDGGFSVSSRVWIRVYSLIFSAWRWLFTAVSLLTESRLAKASIVSSPEG